jgi:glucosyl-3-phosphoglycerate synthase
MIKQFHYRDFLPLEKIVGKKQKSGRKVSLVIPTYNEIDTIGNIVSTAKRELIVNMPLLDEIVVMDGGSDDGTPRRARECGAKVYSLGEMGGKNIPQGKGSALWKSLLVTKGEIIICIDGDIKDFDTRFVYGLLAPLFYEPSVSFVKAYYKRPIVVDDIILHNYGGRVTEILVRPILSTFYPDLAMLFQPLSGEYGFKRDMIIHLPFSAGYGLEIGLILNIYRSLGISSFAQVDMDIRCHRNRSVADLGKMAFAILHVLLKELQKDNKAVFPQDLNTSMITPRGGRWEEMTIDQAELPPIAHYKGEIT